jgi:hypothetical protein
VKIAQEKRTAAARRSVKQAKEMAEQLIDLNSWEQVRDTGDTIAVGTVHADFNESAFVGQAKAALKKALRDDKRHLNEKNVGALRKLQAKADTGTHLRAAKLAMRKEEYKQAVAECVLLEICFLSADLNVA